MLKLYVEREAEMKTDVTGKNRGKVLFFRKLEENDIILMRIYECKRGLGFQTNEAILK